MTSPQRIVSSVLLLLVQAGCAANQKVTLPVAVNPPTGTVQLVDSRPAEQRGFRGPSPLAGSMTVDPKRYLGDENFSPHRVDVLRQKIEARLGGRSAGSPVSVQLTRFEVIDHYEKTHQERKASDVGNSLGLVGLIVEQSMKPGASVQDRYICEIAGTAQSRTFGAKLERPYDSTSADSALIAMIDLCTDMAAQDLVSKIGAARGGSRKPARAKRSPAKPKTSP